MDSCRCALSGNFRVGISRKDQDLEGISCNIKTSCQTGKPVIRFETQPGQQIQVDFTTIRRNNTTLKAFVATLGYSRATFVKFYDHERTDVWIDGLENAFQFFAVVPQEILFNNAKTIMIERDAYQEGQHKWNTKLLDCAKKYSFRPRVCKPYRALNRTGFVGDFFI